jgi:hypothetical protein
MLSIVESRGFALPIVPSSLQCPMVELHRGNGPVRRNAIASDSSFTSV